MESFHRVVDVPVVKPCHVPLDQKMQCTVEVPQIQYNDRIVNVPPPEAGAVQYIDRIANLPVSPAPPPSFLTPALPPASTPGCTDTPFDWMSSNGSKRADSERKNLKSDAMYCSLSTLHGSGCAVDASRSTGIGLAVVEYATHAGVQLPFYAEDHIQMLPPTKLREHATLLYRTIGHQAIGTVVPIFDAELPEWITNVQRIHLAHLVGVGGNTGTVGSTIGGSTSFWATGASVHNAGATRVLEGDVSAGVIAGNLLNAADTKRNRRISTVDDNSVFVTNVPKDITSSMLQEVLTSLTSARLRAQMHYDTRNVSRGTAKVEAAPGVIKQLLSLDDKPVSINGKSRRLRVMPYKEPTKPSRPPGLNMVTASSGGGLSCASVFGSAKAPPVTATAPSATTGSSGGFSVAFSMQTLMSELEAAWQATRNAVEQVAKQKEELLTTQVKHEAKAEAEKRELQKLQEEFLQQRKVQQDALQRGREELLEQQEAHRKELEASEQERASHAKALEKQRQDVERQRSSLEGRVHVLEAETERLATKMQKARMKTLAARADAEAARQDVELLRRAADEAEQRATAAVAESAQLRARAESTEARVGELGSEVRRLTQLIKATERNSQCLEADHASAPGQVENVDTFELSMPLAPIISVTSSTGQIHCEHLEVEAQCLDLSPRAIKAVCVNAQEFARQNDRNSDHACTFTAEALRKCGLRTAVALSSAPDEQWPRNEKGQPLLPPTLISMIQRSAIELLAGGYGVQAIPESVDISDNSDSEVEASDPVYDSVLWSIDAKPGIMPVGHVATFNQAKQWGFITPQSTSRKAANKDVFVHQSDVNDGGPLHPDEPVTFDVISENYKGRPSSRAINVTRQSHSGDEDMKDHSGDPCCQEKHQGADPYCEACYGQGCQWCHWADDVYPDSREWRSHEPAGNDEAWADDVNPDPREWHSHETAGKDEANEVVFFESEAEGSMGLESMGMHNDDPEDWNEEFVEDVDPYEYCTDDGFE